MRILQINSHYNQSGAGKIVAYIHKELIKQGHESMVAYGRGKVTDDIDIYRIGTKVEVAFEGFVTRIIGINGFTSWNATKELLNKIKEFRPDVIHLHGLHGYYLNFKILFDFINENNISCVWTFHDCHAFSGNCGYHYECEKWKTACDKCPHLRDYPSTYWFDNTKWMWKEKKKIFTKTDNKVIVSPSEWMTNDVKQSFFGKYECITINNGIDTEYTFYYRDKSACREKHGYKEEDKIALGIAFGLDDPRKGVKYMIQLAKDLEKESVKLILIGWNSKNDSLIKGLKNIEAIPFTNNQDELAEYYSLADVFLLPSLAENYATVTLESLACGTPVVGFDVGGIPEQLSNGRGLVVEKGNQKEFNNAVLDILNGVAEIVRKEDMIAFTRQNNSISTMVGQYENVYRELIERTTR